MLYKIKTIDGGEVEIPEVSTKLCICDTWGMIKMRMNLGRMSYTVEPGLYAVGNPGAGSRVFASANYKYSFDLLRKSLSGIDCWILVLDTDGINVWCAAGKGTFGTAELIRQITESGLSRIVTHKQIIVPQLGAPGVAAHEIRKRTGFKVVYGPVRAGDLREFIRTNSADPSMRRVVFNMFERIKLIPVEVSVALKYVFGIIAFLFLFAFLRGGFSIGNHLWIPAVLVASAFTAGTMLTPILLPYLPGRPFAIKGTIANAFLTGGLILVAPGFSSMALFDLIAWGLMTTGFSSFLAMNYTGATTFTSLSGVKKEVGIFMPIQIFMMAAGLLMWLIEKSVNGFV